MPLENLEGITTMLLDIANLQPNELIQETSSTKDHILLAEEFGITTDELAKARADWARGFNARETFRDFLTQQRIRT